MSFTVPTVRRSQSSGSILPPTQGQTPALNPVFLLTAASQMHSEGRLIAEDRSGTDAKMKSIPEADQTPLRT